MPSKCSTCKNHIHLIADWEEVFKFCKICDYSMSGESGVRECTEYRANIDTGPFRLIQHKVISSIKVSQEEIERAFRDQKLITCRLCKREQDESKLSHT